MPDELDVVDALLGLEAEAEIERLGGASAVRAGDPAAAPLEERVDDHLSRARVAQAFRESSAAAGLPSSEHRRRPLRALAPRFLARASREPETELAERRKGHDVPETGFEAALAGETSPGERDALFERWLALERDLARAAADRAEAREDAARAAGAPRVSDLLGAAHAVAPAELLDPFERGAIAPLDENVARAAAALWREHGRGGASRHAADAPRVHRMGHAPWPAAAEIAALARRLRDAAGLGVGPRLEIGLAPAIGARAAWRLTRAGTAWVGVGACTGPVGLREALGALGRAARGAFVAATRGSSFARFGDPAFEHAADVLFGRLALCRHFRESAQIPENAAARAVLGLHESVATRIAWVYLQAVLANVDAEGRAFARAIERATGGPVTPAHREDVRDRDPMAAAALRGTVLGLLLEERLRSRFGRGWFASSRARSWLQSVWEAEPDHTAEELAAAAELGAIEPTPVLDAHRAALQEGSGR